MNFSVKKINVNGTGISYIEKGQGKLMIFLHGFPDNPLTFKNQIDYFARQGYRVVAPYMRGYFPSDIPSDNKYYTLTLGEDVVELIKAIGSEKAIVVGHDWGANAAYSATMIAPELFEKIVGASVVRGTFSKALITNQEQQRKSWYIYFFQTLMAETALSFNDYAFIRRLYKDWSSPGFEVPEDHIKAVIETFKHEGVAKATINYYRCFFNTSGLSPEEAMEQKRISYDKINVKTLYLHGEKDGCIGVEVTEGMEYYFGEGFVKKIIKDAGHFIHLEKPDEFNESILEFISRV